jgi:hypothetical protein
MTLTILSGFIAVLFALAGYAWVYSLGYARGYELARKFAPQIPAYETLHEDSP